MNKERKSVLGAVIDDGRFIHFTPELDVDLLRKANQVAIRSAHNGDYPFGCLLADGDGNVILEAECRALRDKDPTSHAEVNLVKMAVKKFGVEYLWQCSAYVSGGPCAMCAGTLYWGNVGRIVYAIVIEQEEETRDSVNRGEHRMLGADFRDILATGTKDIVIDGPYDELRDEIFARFSIFDFEEEKLRDR